MDNETLEKEIRKACYNHDLKLIYKCINEKVKINKDIFELLFKKIKDSPYKTCLIYCCCFIKDESIHNYDGHVFMDTIISECVNLLVQYGGYILTKEDIILMSKYQNVTDIKNINKDYFNDNEFIENMRKICLNNNKFIYNIKPTIDDLKYVLQNNKLNQYNSNFIEVSEELINENNVDKELLLLLCANDFFVNDGIEKNLFEKIKNKFSFTKHEIINLIKCNYSIGELPKKFTYDNNFMQKLKNECKKYEFFAYGINAEMDVDDLKNRIVKYAKFNDIKNFTEKYNIVPNIACVKTAVNNNVNRKILVYLLDLM